MKKPVKTKGLLGFTEKVKFIRMQKIKDVVGNEYLATSSEMSHGVAHRYKLLSKSCDRISPTSNLFSVFGKTIGWH